MSSSLQASVRHWVRGREGGSKLVGSEEANDLSRSAI
jgi:hypothetical protein